MTFTNDKCPPVVSAAAALSLDEILQEKHRLDGETKQPMSMIYQVYVQKDRDRTEKAVREAVEGGCKWVSGCGRRKGLGG